MPAQPWPQIADFYRRALLDDVAPFWLRCSLDHEFGGYVTCLDREGRWYGTDKAVWLQGREVWLFATLYHQVERRPEWLAAAQLGCDFLLRHCFAPNGKMYFLVTRDGRPLRMRRYAYSEVFGVLAFAAMARATGDDALRSRAAALFDRFMRYLRVPGLLEPKVDPGTRPAKGLSPLMCVLNTAESLLQLAASWNGGDAEAVERYERILDQTIAEILRDFVKLDRGCVLEAVGPDGAPLEGPEGRVMNPGHAIECAWFILDTARRRGDHELARDACRIVDIAFERGWDPQHGGLLYFIDVDGQPPTQLEHDMKLWWPHNEALIAALMAFAQTREARYEQMFHTLHDWTFRHFPDPQFGEWFGYLRRDGSLSTPLKGGLWKGAFHVPRALLMCGRLAERL